MISFLARLFGLNRQSQHFPLVDEFNFDPRAPQSPTPEDFEAIQRNAERFTGKNPYKIGDWVTPRPDGYMKGVGLPYLVVDVSDSMLRNMESPGSNGYFTTPTIRVLRRCPDGEVAAYWTDHTQFDPYNWARP